MLGADFEFLDQLPRRAGVAEAVFYADGAGDQRDAVELWAFGQMALTRHASAPI